MRMELSGRVVSVQRGRPRTIEHGGELVSTAIFKDAAAGPVLLGALGFEGDGQADREHHGGVDQAAYAYPREHYAHWAARLPDRIHEPGLFGENLTTEGLLENDLHPGDRFQVGGACVEVTTPRVPCFKLGLRTGDPGIVAPFLASGRLGFYLRVLEEGPVAAGDPIRRLERAPHDVTMADLIAALFDPHAGEALRARALAMPGLPGKLRRRLEARGPGHG